MTHVRTKTRKRALLRKEWAYIFIATATFYGLIYAAIFFTGVIS
jgi:hypothetical protein